MKLMLLIVIAVGLGVEAQTPSTRTFEVASIKPATWPSQAYFEGFTAAAGNCNRVNLKIDGLRVIVSRASICGLIRTVYGMQRYQVLGVPKWTMERVPEVYFDIQGQAAQGQGQAAQGPMSEQDAQAMLRELLADRFALKFHRETRELPVYALTVAKGGPKLSRSEIQCGASPWKGRYRGSAACKPNTTMSQLASQLTDEVDRPVIDRTGLGGGFAFALAWLPETEPVTPNSPPGLFTAVQDQLGLKLDATKADVEVLVIDAVERPSEN